MIKNEAQYRLRPSSLFINIFFDVVFIVYTCFFSDRATENIKLFEFMNLYVASIYV